MTHVKHLAGWSMSALVVSALTGGLAGSIVSLLGSWLVQRSIEQRRKKDEVSEVSAAIIQDVDGLIESFESLYADASDCVGTDLADRLTVFKFIEPVSFGNKYRLRSAISAAEMKKIDDVRYTLRDLRQSHELLAVQPPAVEATDHWEDVQTFLGELNEVRESLVSHT